MDADEVEKKLYIRKYMSRLETSINIYNGYRLQEFELQSRKDRKNDFLNEIEFFKSQGRLN
jgi:hypothetical protein